MRKRNLFIIFGLIIYVVSSFVDRFVYKIPDYLFIILSLVEIACVITGIIIRKKEN